MKDRCTWPLDGDALGTSGPLLPGCPTPRQGQWCLQRVLHDQVPAPPLSISPPVMFWSAGVSADRRHGQPASRLQRLLEVALARNVFGSRRNAFVVAAGKEAPPTYADIVVRILEKHFQGATSPRKLSAICGSRG